MSIKLDEWGDHAEDCPCERCEAGYGPTDRQRAASKHAALVAAATKARLQAQPQPIARLSRSLRPTTPIPPPMSEAELAAMRADIERLRSAKR